MVGMEQAAQGSGHSPELLEFKECLDAALRHRVCCLGGPVWSQELDLMVLVGPFQFGISNDSMIPRVYIQPEALTWISALTSRIAVPGCIVL